MIKIESTSAVTPQYWRAGEVVTIVGNVPGKANNYHVFGRRFVRDKTIEDYEHSFGLQWLNCGANHVYRAIDKPFALTLDVSMQRERKDLDNCVKTVLDCLQEVGAIADDYLCHRIVATKHVTKDPMCQLSITPFDANKGAPLAAG